MVWDMGGETSNMAGGKMESTMNESMYVQLDNGDFQLQFFPVHPEN